MNDPCEKMRDKIADYVLGALGREEINAFDEHITSCSQCRKYTEALQNEKSLLLQLGENLDKEMTAREDKVIEALKQVSCEKVRLPSVWRITLKRPVIKLAAAACVIIAVTFGMHQFGVKVAGASTTWAKVLQSIREATTVVYESTIEIDGHKQKSRNMVNEFGVERVEDEDGKVLLYDFPNGIYLTLDPNAKKASITHMTGSPLQGKPFNILHHITRWKDAGKLIGQQKIDGKNTDMYVFEEPLEKATVWVDAETCLPVRFERVSIPNPDKDLIVPRMSISFKDFGGDSNDVRSMSIAGSGIIDKPTTFTESNYQWNVEVDESLFNMTPPADYTIDEKQMNASLGDKNHLIEALAFWAEMSDGVFPDKISDLGDPNRVKPMLIKKFYKGVSPKAEFDLAYKEMNIILNGLFMAECYKADGIWGYAGQGVKLGQADTPICWWKPGKAQKWRVIYANLSIKDVNSADLPHTKSAVALRIIEPQLVLYTIHRGGYETIVAAARELFALAGQKGMSICGPVSNVYLNDPYHVSKEHLLTEIRIPVDEKALNFAGTLGEMTDVKALPEMTVVFAIKPQGLANPTFIYSDLSTWIYQHGYITIGVPIENFLSNANTGNYAQMKTELMIPVKKAETGRK